MKLIATLLIVAAIVFAGIRISQRLNAYYEYENSIGSYWSLSERAATIVQKSEYMDKYVSAIESCSLNGMNDALFYPTEKSSFDQNIKAIKSLQKRLKDISTMDESGFAYQTAIQQITAQEQGEGQDMINNINSCWMKKNHYSLWNIVIGIVFFIIQGTFLVVGISLVQKNSY